MNPQMSWSVRGKMRRRLRLTSGALVLFAASGVLSCKGTAPAGSAAGASGQSGPGGAGIGAAAGMSGPGGTTGAAGAAGGGAGSSAAGAAGRDASGAAGADAATDARPMDAPVTPPVDGGGASGAALPRVVAYVNCLCGFGAGADGQTCLGVPDPSVNQVKAWEDDGQSPITHYVISFLSFKGADIQSDPGSIWKNGGGSTTDFALAPGLRDALQSARAHGKKVMLSLGGEVGSSGFLAWWSAQGAGTSARVSGMRAKVAAAVAAFTSQNDVGVDGVDVDIELGGGYSYTSDKYQATRDLINAVPDDLLVAFVPQVGNGLCAAPVVNDPLPPPTVLGGQCMMPSGDDASAPWTLARLDQDCVRDGKPRLDYFGVQYYNAATAECCGGGGDDAAMVRSTAQNYVNLANGWPAAGDVASTSNPWHAYQYFPGPWAAFGGIGADRLVLGKPACRGCAGSNYLSPTAMKDLFGRLDGKLAKAMGGILFWDLCRLFGNTGTLCVSGSCQPSWNTGDPRAGLADLRAAMLAIRARAP
ncbi:MAG TPA: glycosyl hydrolase family 18 protein [Polyangia bacterium]|nr:glycosyl hydrolase family 18 protein [Polyangia bacterium]